MPGKRSYVPDTASMVAAIFYGGYSSFRQFCKDNPHIKRGTAQLVLQERAAENNTDDYNRVMRAAKLKTKEEYDAEFPEYPMPDASSVTSVNTTSWTPNITSNITFTSQPNFAQEYREALGVEETFDSEEAIYNSEEVEAIIRGERARARSYMSKNTQLQRALFERREQIDAMTKIFLRSYTDYVGKHPETRIYNLSGKRARHKWTGMAPIADPHIGKYVYGAEGWGRDYDTEIACERIVEAAEETAAWIDGYVDRCAKMYLPDVGDFWHALDNQTENGTILHQDTRTKRVIDMGLEALFKRIDTIAAMVEEADVLFTEGNHDHDWLHLTYLVVKEHYRNHPRVNVQLDMRRKAHFVHGTTGIVFDHGRGINKLSTPTAIMRMQNVFEKTLPGAPYNPLTGEHEYSRRYFFCGHLHYREYVYLEEGKDVYIRLPAMCEGDSYEEGLRVTSSPGAVAYRLDENGWIDSTKEINFS